MFDWIPLIGDWSGLAQTLLLVVAPLLFLIPAYALHYRANYVWEPKRKHYAGEYHWAALPSDAVVFIAWSFAAVAGILVGISAMLEVVSFMSFGEAAIFIFLAATAGSLIAIGLVGASTHRISENSAYDVEMIIVKAAVLIPLVFFGIVVGGVALAAMVLIPIGGLAVLGEVSFPAQSGGEFSFGIMSLIILSVVFIWGIAVTVWD